MSFLLTEVAKINDFTPTGYFHTLAATKFEDAFWIKSAKKLAQKAAEVMKALNAHPFTLRHPNHHLWTPAHVAVMMANMGAIQFFSCQMQAFDVKDAWGKSAFDYGVNLWPKNLLPALLPKPMVPHSVRGKPLEPRGPQSADDFEKSLSKILVALPFKYDEKQLDLIKREGQDVTHIVENLRSIGVAEGFAIDHAIGCLSIRDYFFHGANGLTSTIPNGIGFDDTLARNLSCQLYYGKDPLAYLYHPIIGHAIGHHFRNVEWPRTQFREGFKKDFQVCPLYLEKGNLYHVTTPDGVPSLLIGEEMRGLMLLHARKNKVFEEASLQLEERVEKELANPEFDIDELTLLAERMYALGCLKIDSTTGAISKDQRTALLDETFFAPIRPNETFRERAIRSGFLKPFVLPPKDVGKFRREITRFKVQEQCVKEILAKQFGVAPESIHYIQKIFYHLDTYVLPGPNGSVFVLDYKASLDLLNQMKPKLGKEDLELLTAHEASLSKLLEPLLPLIQRMQEQLKSAGFKVIPAPAFFCRESTEFSLFNAITGYPKGKSHPLMMPFGIQEGKQFGSVMMELVADFFTSQIPGLKVYYLARNVFHSADYSAADGWRKRGIGPHCLTVELLKA